MFMRRRTIFIIAGIMACLMMIGDNLTSRMTSSVKRIHTVTDNGPHANFDFPNLQGKANYEKNYIEQKPRKRFFGKTAKRKRLKKNSKKTSRISKIAKKAKTAKKKLKQKKKKSRLAKAKPGLTPKPPVKKSPTQRPELNPDNRESDQNIAEVNPNNLLPRQGGATFLPPADEQVENTAGKEEEENLLDVWRRKLFVKPDPDVTGDFVGAFLSSEIDSKTYYTLIEEMFADKKYQTLAIGALGGTPTLHSFELLVEWNQLPEQEEDTQKLIGQELDRYASLDRVTVLKSALLSESDPVKEQGLTELNKLTNTLVSQAETFQEGRNRRLSGETDLQSLGAIVPTLDELCGESSDSPACESLGHIRSLDETLVSQFP